MSAGPTLEVFWKDSFQGKYWANIQNVFGKKFMEILAYWHIFEF